MELLLRNRDAAQAPDLPLSLQTVNFACWCSPRPVSAMRSGIFVSGVCCSHPGVEEGEGEEAGQAVGSGAGLERLEGGLGVGQGQADGAGGIFGVPAGEQAAEQGAFERGQSECSRAGVCHVRV